jgi:hypothetical protein
MKMWGLAEGNISLWTDKVLLQMLRNIEVLDKLSWLFGR